MPKRNDLPPKLLSPQTVLPMKLSDPIAVKLGELLGIPLTETCRSAIGHLLAPNKVVAPIVEVTTHAGEKIVVQRFISKIDDYSSATAVLHTCGILAESG